MLPRCTSLRRGVVKRDHARNVHPKRNDLAAVPADISNRLCRRQVRPPACTRARHRGDRTDRSTTRTARAATTVGYRPRRCARERTRRPSRRDTRTDLTSTPGPPNIDRIFVPIDFHSRIGVEIETAQRHERRHRRAQIHSRGAVDIEAQFLFVLVLLAEEATTCAGGPEQSNRRRAARARGRAATKASKEYYRWSNGSSDVVSHRRQLADVSRLPRVPRTRAVEPGGPIHTRGLRLRHDAAEAARRSPPGLHRCLVRPGRPYLSR